MTEKKLFPNMSYLSAKTNSIALMQMYTIIEEMYTVSLLYWLPDAVLLLFDDLLLLDGKLRFKANKKNLKD